MARRPAATRQKWVRFPPAFLSSLKCDGSAHDPPKVGDQVRFLAGTVARSAKEAAMHTTDWWQTFFNGLALDMWRAAVSPEQTRTEADYLQRTLAVPEKGK